MAAELALTLRPMHPDDFAAVSDLWVEAWAAAYPALDFEARRPWFAAHLGALAEEGAQPFVAMADARLAGLATIDPATGYLDQLVVGVSFQAQRVAERLLAHAQQLSPGRVMLDVNQDNARAIRFYEKHGFAIVGEDVNLRGAPTFRMRWTAPASRG